LLAAFPFSHASEKTYETEKQLASLLLISIFFLVSQSRNKAKKVIAWIQSAEQHISLSLLMQPLTNVRKVPRVKLCEAWSCAIIISTKGRTLNILYVKVLQASVKATRSKNRFFRFKED